MEEVVPSTREERIRRFVELRSFLRHRLPEIEKEARTLEAQLLEELDEAGIDKLKLENGPTIWVGKPKTQAFYKKDRFRDVERWLRGHRSGDIVKHEKSIHHSTFSATVAKLMESGVSIPSFIETTSQRKVGWRNGAG
jgi:tRNA nucleotidyltransferase (CCA-adding enzyme)